MPTGGKQYREFYNKVVRSKKLVGVFRYTERLANYVQRVFHVKVKSEPWLHIYAEVIKTHPQRDEFGRPNSAFSAAQVNFAIYVWDTRKILGQYATSGDAIRIGDAERFMQELLLAEQAVDNHKKLDGGVKFEPITKWVK